MAIILDSTFNPINNPELKKIGITTDFTDPKVFISTFTTKDSIKQALINFFLTFKGERYLNLDVGNTLITLLFSSQGELDQEQLSRLELNIKQEIERKFPQIEITDAIFIIDDINQSLNISLEFTIINTNITDTLSFNIGI